MNPVKRYFKKIEIEGLLHQFKSHVLAEETYRAWSKFHEVLDAAGNDQKLMDTVIEKGIPVLFLHRPGIFRKLEVGKMLKEVIDRSGFPTALQEPAFYKDLIIPPQHPLGEDVAVAFYLPNGKKEEARFVASDQAGTLDDFHVFITSDHERIMGQASFFGVVEAKKYDRDYDKTYAAELKAAIQEDTPQELPSFLEVVQARRRGDNSVKGKPFPEIKCCVRQVNEIKGEKFTFFI